ncbi:ADP-ribosylation factor-related protein 1 [Schistosoma japonicum]|nr:ADP-ribosylation factor-related protein 1 [Schistosoma japonicum]
MYTLLHGFWHYLSQKNEFSVLILGLDGAGKTTYLERAKINFVPNYKSIPMQKITTTVGLNSGIRLKFWDLGGQEELQSLWDKYYAESNGVIYVIDSADSDRFNESRNAFDKMVRNPVLEGVPLLVLANKQDMQNAFHLSEINKVFYDSLHLVGQRQCTFHGVSALNGEGINSSIKWIVDKVRSNATRRPPRQHEIS